MGTLCDAGRRMLFWGALILVVWAAYELFVRVDAMALPLGMFFRMWFGEKVPFGRAITYVDWRILETPGLLVLCILLGVIALSTRRKVKMGLVIIPLSVLMGFVLVGVRGLITPNIWQTLKLLPLILMVLGSLFSLIFHYAFLSKQKKRGIPPGTDRNAMPYDPFGMRGTERTRDNQYKGN